MSEDYPKVIETGGILVTVTSAEEEARWTQPAAVSTTAPDEVVLDVPASDEPRPAVLDDQDGVPPADPLDDVSIDMENEKFQPPAKTKGGAKKK